MALVVSEINTTIRFLLGGLSTSILSDEILNFIIEQNILEYGDLDENECIVTYQSLLEALQYLDRRAMQGSAATGASGELKKIEERIGQRVIKKEFETGTDGGTSASWGTMYTDFLNHPEYVCSSLVDPNKQKSLVIIGGVSQKEYDRVKSNPDSRNGWSMGNICGQRRNRGY